MSHVVVMPWQRKKASVRPELTGPEVDEMAAVVRHTLDLLVQGINAGQHDLDERLTVLHGTAEALMNGQKVSVTISAKRKKP